MSIKINDTNRIPNSLRGLSSLNGKKIDVGVFGDEEMAMIAAVHEFGSPKMNIPERSYLRSGYDEHIDETTKQIEKFIPVIIGDGIDAEAFLEAVGMELKGKIQQNLVSIETPRLKDETIKRKGSSNPLVDEGNLLENIDYRVE